jgi:hypothetical protein
METNSKLIIGITVILLIIVGCLVGIGITTQSNAVPIMKNTSAYNITHAGNSSVRSVANSTQDIKEVRPPVTQKTT